jgi:hypothetical protein
VPLFRHVISVSCSGHNLLNVPAAGWWIYRIWREIISLPAISFVVLRHAFGCGKGAGPPTTANIAFLEVQSGFADHALFFCNVQLHALRDTAKS